MGKTTLVKQIFTEKPELVHVYLNCDDLVSSSDLFIRITRDLNRKLANNKRKKVLPSKMMGLDDFRERLEELSEIVQKLPSKHSKIFVILDNIEQWKRTFILDCIVTLSTLSELLNLVLISSESVLDMIEHIKSVSSRFRIQDRSLEIEVTQWGKNDIIDMILRTPPTKHVALYQMFVKNAVTIHPSRSANFVSMKNYCQTQFTEFVELCKSEFGDGSPEDSNSSDEKLIESSIRRHPTIVQKLIRQFVGQTESAEPGQDNMRWLARDQQIVMSMGVLIVAIYVAAYTKTSDDKRNFVRYQKKVKTRKSTLQHLEDEDPASRTFTMERVIQLYRRLFELAQPREPSDEQDNGGSSSPERDTLDRHTIPDSVLGDLQFLEDLKMVHIYSGDGLDSTTRFKIAGHMTRDYVERIAQQVDLSLDQLHGL